MRKKFFILVLLLLLTSIVFSSLLVDIRVHGVIDSHIPYITAEELLMDRPQEFLMEIDNIGSVGCNFRVRIDVYDGLQLIHTAWSEGVPLEPGDCSDFRAYFYPTYPGNFSAKVLIHSCNQITKGPVLNFTVIKPETEDVNKSSRLEGAVKKREDIFEISAVNNKSSVGMKIKSTRNVTDLLIIPREYPLGWIVESGKIGNMQAGVEKTVEIGYAPSIWNERELVFDIVSLDGKYHTTKSIMLKEEEENILKKFAIQILWSIILILLTVTVYLLKERRKIKEKENS
ncbi:MAG: hypothetical protein U9Q22_08045 [Candidatus Altiarchaeota archaeon]|nr:hypothetical protein [Candidatus Altiarchaeota archaeon]